ncbi:MAG: hypothetical protein RRX93_02595 [Bacteroidales bacterium]
MKRLIFFILLLLGVGALPTYGQENTKEDKVEQERIKKGKKNSQKGKKDLQKDKSIANDSTKNKATKEDAQWKEEVKEEVKEEFKQVGEDLKQTGRELKEQGLSIWSTVKEKALEIKEEAVEFFGTNIKTNVVGAFSDTRRENNQMYCNHLREPWVKYPIKIYAPLVYMEAGVDSIDRVSLQGSIPITGIKELKTWNTPPIDPPGENELISKQNISFECFGVKMSVDLDPTTCRYSAGNLSEKSIAVFWQKLSETRFDIALYQFEELRKKYNLNDWAFYQMLLAASPKVMVKDKVNEQAIWVAFMLNQAGYPARLGRMSLGKTSKVLLMVPVYEKIYGTPVVEIDGGTYYLFDKLSLKQRTGEIYTYRGTFAMATSPLSLQMQQVYNLPKLYEKKGIYAYNERLSEVYKKYPPTQTAIYYTTPLGYILERSFNSKMGRVLDSIVEKNKALGEAVAKASALVYLMNYLRTQFPLSGKIAEDIAPGTGLFPEEIFAFQGADSRDRSILLAHLCEKFLKLKVVLIEYPLYVVAAVKFDFGKKEPSSLVIDHPAYLQSMEGKYYICDPNNIETKIGFLSAKWQGKTAFIIE